MKKFFKSSLTMFLVAVMMFGAVSLKEFAGLELIGSGVVEKFAVSISSLFDEFAINAKAETYTSGYYEYSVDELGFATIEDVSSSIRGNVTIPSTLGGYTVSSIGDYAFLSCNNITSIIIPDCVKKIGSDSLRSESVISVIIGNGVTEIGESAFHCCDNLTTVTLGSKVTNIGKGAFYGCDKLTNIAFPESLVSIGADAFALCDSFTEVLLGDNVTNIGDYAFYACDNLQTVSLGKGLINLGEWSLYGCDNLTTISLWNSLKNIGEGVFYSSEKLTDVYYYGTKKEWNEIFIGNDNDDLFDANIHFISSSLIFPSEYNFDEDSYSFENQGRFLSEKYFTGIYGYSKGKLMYEKHKKGAYNGVCFGMAYTTASILEGYPNISEIKNNEKGCTKLNDAKSGSKVNIGDMTITLLDYIKYAFVYQWSWDSVYSRAFNQLTSTGIIEEAIENNSYVVLDIMTKEYGGHTVLAVGYEEVSDNKAIIYVDDSNSPDKLQTITVEDGKWEFSNSWVNEEINNSNTKYIACHTDYTKPYHILKTGAYVATDDECSEYYIYGLDPVDSDRFLFSLSTNNCSFDAQSYLMISDYTSETEVETTEETEGNLYWLNDKSVTVSDIIEDNTEVSFAGNDVLLTAKVDVGAVVTMTIDETETSVTVDADKGEEFLISFASQGENEEEIIFTLSDVSSGEEIKAVETETGIKISGATSGEITLTVDGEVVSNYSFGNAQGDVNVEYDKKSASSEMNVVYENSLETLGDIIGDFEIENKGTLNITPEIAIENCTLSYSSSDSDVVTVDESGNVRAENIGTATIVCTVTDEYGNTYSDTSNVTVLPREFNITWIVDSVETTETVAETSEIIAPQTPQKPGYTFTGWTPEVPDIMPAEDLTFTATWKANTYDAVFDANGGKWADGAAEKTVPTAFDSQITAPEAPTKQGYIFSKWSPEVGVMDSVDGKTFVAEWIAATDTRYTVETYTMNTSGEYVKTTNAFNGTTGESVSVNPTVQTGFTLNKSKSVLSGNVAGDNSLVLKVYIDRNTYTLTTVADGISTSTRYLYGSLIAEPATPVKTGYKFIKWDKTLPETMPAKNITLTAVFDTAYTCPDCGDEIVGESAIAEHIAAEARAKSTVSIKNNPEIKTIKYGETLRLTAIASKPDDVVICWYVDGVKKGEGTTFDLKFESGTKTVEVKLEDADGNTVCNPSGAEISDSEEVTVNAGFFQKIISFFKNLFRMDRTVIQ